MWVVSVSIFSLESNMKLKSDMEYIRLGQLIILSDAVRVKLLKPQHLDTTILTVLR